MISVARAHSRNVKNWQSGTMALRWCAAGMIEARGQFRRVNGHLHLPALRAALDAHVAAETVGAHGHREQTLLHITCQLGHHHRHSLGQHRRRRVRSSFLVVLLHSGPLSRVDLAVAQHLP